MRRAVLLTVVLVAACEATAPPPAPVSPAQREVTERVMALGKEIDELSGRYEGLLKQNAAIEQLLARLGFSAQMTVDTVAQRVEMMRRFEHAEAARTAAYEKLRGLLRTLADQHHLECYVEVRNGNIVVYLAESALFDAKTGRLRGEVNPLLWAIAEGLKELTGRRFEVVTEVAPDAPAPAPTPPKAKARPKAAKRLKAAHVVDPWAAAADRAAALVRAFEGAGLAAERLAAVERPLDPTEVRRGAGRYVQIVVLPTREELPRVHGAVDAALAPPPAAPEKPLPDQKLPPEKAPPAGAPAPTGR